jgi:membrane-bound lytic murein transglycosylase D
MRFTLALCSLLAACTGLPSQHHSDASVLPTAAGSITEVTATTASVAETENHDISQDAISASVPVQPNDLWSYIASLSTWDVPARPEIEAAREYWLSQPELLATLDRRAQPALQLIVAATIEADLPIEVALLPIVESSLSPWAYSHQHAAGLWQIMPATAAHYGIPKDWWFDGRYDYEQSTEFALAYLSELHSQFDQDWLLALAAYNAGRGRVSRAMAQLDETVESPYWSLDLPRETDRYVPRLLGLLALIREPPEDWQWPDTPIAAGLQSVDTRAQIEFSQLASLSGLEEKELRRLNPAHRRWATGPDSPTTILVPEPIAESLQMAIDQLSPSERVQWAYYRIESGDSLIRIARRFDTQVELLRSINHIVGSRIRAGDTLLIPRGTISPATDQPEIVDYHAQKPRWYRVQTGDSLWTIARRFGISVANLSAWNNLSEASYIHPGQRLKLRQ